MKVIKGLVAGLLAAGLSLSAVAEQPIANPAELHFAPDRLDRITTAFQSYVDSGKIPGAVLLVARKEKIAYFKAIGFRDREAKEAMQPDAIFRLASIEKSDPATGAT